jgi:mRNA interferase RelE/StbE
MKKELKLTYLKKAKKFLDKNKSVIDEKQVDELVIKFIKKHFFNCDENVDYKQLQGNLKDYYRIRKSNIRLIIRVIDDNIIIEAIIEDIGYRGDIYK